MIKATAFIALAGTIFANALPRGLMFSERNRDFTIKAGGITEPKEEVKRGYAGANTDTPDPTQIHIANITYGGTGCRNYSLSSIISSDRASIKLILDQYDVFIGPAIPIVESRKNCQVGLNLTYPIDFQYSVLSTDYNGYGELDEGVEAILKSVYYFSGNSTASSTGATFDGPFSGEYLYHNIVSNEAWSSCDRNDMLYINSRIILNSTVSGAQGFLNTDSIDSHFTQIIYITWRKCMS